MTPEQAEKLAGFLAVKLGREPHEAVHLVALIHEASNNEFLLKRAFSQEHRDEIPDTRNTVVTVFLHGIIKTPLGR